MWSAIFSAALIHALKDSFFVYSFKCTAQDLLAVYYKFHPSFTLHWQLIVLSCQLLCQLTVSQTLV